MRRQLYPALMMTVVFTVLLGIAYPLAVTGVAQGVFVDRADGSKVEVDGVVVGSLFGPASVQTLDQMVAYAQGRG